MLVVPAVVMMMMMMMMPTCGEIPVRCLRWLLTRLDFFMIECMLSLEILSMRVSSSTLRYFTTVGQKRAH